MKTWRDRADVKEFASHEINKRCAVCDAPGGPWTPHHRHPKAREETYEGDIHSPKNLCMACPECHARYHDALGAVPSQSALRADGVGAAFHRLLKRWPKLKWRMMAPEYVLKAHEDWWMNQAMGGVAKRREE